MIRRPPRSTLDRSSAASDVYKRQVKGYLETSQKFEEELKGIKERLEKIAESRNLSEPFERLKAACEQVQLQRTND